MLRTFQILLKTPLVPHRTLGTVVPLNTFRTCASLRESSSEKRTGKGQGDEAAYKDEQSTGESPSVSLTDGRNFRADADRDFSYGDG